MKNPWKKLEIIERDGGSMELWHMEDTKHYHIDIFADDLDGFITLHIEGHSNAYHTFNSLTNAKKLS